MSYRLAFSSRHVYDPSQPSITVSVRLSANGVEIEDVAKLDTGASVCVFQREIGEALGLDVASGERLRIATAAGGFEAFGHEVRLSAVV